jgi:hypothetical protein
MGIGEEERGGDTNHVSHVVWRVEVYAIPTSIVYQSIHCLNEGGKGDAYVGNRKFTMIPAGQGFLGKYFVSG